MRTGDQRDCATPTCALWSPELHLGWLLQHRLTSHHRQTCQTRCHHRRRQRRQSPPQCPMWRVGSGAWRAAPPPLPPPPHPHHEQQLAQTADFPLLWTRPRRLQRPLSLMRHPRKLQLQQGQGREHCFQTSLSQTGLPRHWVPLRALQLQLLCCCVRTSSPQVQTPPCLHAAVPRHHSVLLSPTQASPLSQHLQHRHPWPQRCLPQLQQNHRQHQQTGC